MSLKGLPNPDLLREYAHRCRRAAKVEANLKKRQLLARHARAFGQLAETVERKRPLAVSMIRDVIASYKRILPKSGKAEALMEQRDNCFAGQAALHRVRMWRQKAEECRIAGEQMMFRDTRAIYFRLADDYEIMARREEERLAIATKRRQRGSRSAS